MKRRTRVILLLFNAIVVIFILASNWHNWNDITSYLPILIVNVIATIGGLVFLIDEIRQSRDFYSPEGYLIGYRLLTSRNIRDISASGNVLTIMREGAYRSPYRTEYIWREGWNEAEDWEQDFPHGLYSLRKSGLKALGNRAYGIIVEVELAGEIHIHEKGYRSQYARVSAIISDDAFASEYFGVPMRKR